jgi:S1-C subfamily serine protease
MKSSVTLLFVLFLVHTSLNSQSVDTWDEFADKVSRKAEQIGNRAEILGQELEWRFENLADRLATRLERLGENLPGYFYTSSDFYNSEGAFLGVESMQISDEKARKLGFDNFYGSYVTMVFPKTGAEKAGIMPFDYLVGVNDHQVSEKKNLTQLLQPFKAGDKILLHLIRDGRKGSFDVVLGDASLYNFDENQMQKGLLGVSPAPGEQEADLDGVTISVNSNTTAYEIGLKAGDVITSINKYPVLDWEDLQTAVGMLSAGDKIDIEYLRNGKSFKASGKMGKRQEPLIVERDRALFDFENRSSKNRDPEIPAYRQSANRAALGVRTSGISRSKARELGLENTYGAYVTEVYKGSAAEKAGIKPFDYITGLGKYEINEWNSLTGLLSYYEPGDKAEVHLIRNGQKLSLPVTFEAPGDSKAVSRNSCEDPFLGVNQSMSRTVDGVRVSPVKNSTALEIGLQNGDVITAINAKKIFDWDDLIAAISSLKVGEEITVEWRRGDKGLRGTAKIKSMADTRKCPNCNCSGIEGILLDIEDVIKDEIESWDNKPDNRNRTSEVIEREVELSDVSLDNEDFMKSKEEGLSGKASLEVDSLNIDLDKNSGKFKVTFTLKNTGNTQVKCFNSSGRVVYDNELSNFSGAFSDDIDLGQNGAGDYFLLIKQGDKHFSRKITLK